MAAAAMVRIRSRMVSTATDTASAASTVGAATTKPVFASLTKKEDVIDASQVPSALPKYRLSYLERFARNDEVNWLKLYPLHKRESWPALQQQQGGQGGQGGTRKTARARVGMPRIMGPNHSLTTIKTMVEINPGVDGIKVPYVSEWMKMTDAEQKDFLKKYNALSPSQKLLAVANMVSRAYDEVKKKNETSRKLVAGGFYPPPIRVLPPVVALKATLEITAMELCSFYKLNPVSYDIVKQIVGPRYDPKEGTITLVSSNKKLSNAEHKMKLEILLTRIVQQAKKVEEEMKYGTSKITIDDIRKKDQEELAARLTEDFNKIIAEEQRKASGSA